MRIFVDRHHSDLFYSFQLLADRLGADLFCPAGLEWFDKGFWKIGDPYPNPRETACQYLDTEQVFTPVDGTPVLNRYIGHHGGEYKVLDTVHGVTIQGISYNAFLQSKWDFVISSYQPHDEPYSRLAAMVLGKHIAQIGNIWQVSTVKDQLIANGSTPGPDINYISYHPEFNAKLLTPIHNTQHWQNIKSFMRCPKEKARDYNYWLELKGMLPDYRFFSYGGGDDGNLHSMTDMAASLETTGYVYHVKEHGDGYGFVLHYAFAAGRPVITSVKDYEGKLGRRLLTHGETCIDIDQFVNMQGVAEYIKSITPDKYIEMHDNVLARFKEVVDFEKEAEELKQFFNNLV